MTGWDLVLALHILGAVLWVGGMAFALMVLRPSLAALEPPQRMALHLGVFRRFFLVVWHAVGVLLLTGYAMVFGIYHGFAGADWPVRAMHGLGWLMVAIFAWIFFRPWAELRRAPSPEAAERIRRLVSVNLVLGVATVVIAALGHY